MPPEVWLILGALLGLGVGCGATWYLVRRQDRLNLHSADARIKEIVSRAENNAANVLPYSQRR